MILGIGIDSVEIERFAHWYAYDRKKLLRIFSEGEIEYCLSSIHKSAERFAVRYAAREALFKAINQTFYDQQIPFLRLCKAVEIKKKSCGKPILIIEWELIHSSQLNNCNTLLSLTHTKYIATAMVILESNKI